MINRQNCRLCNTLTNLTAQPIIYVFACFLGYITCLRLSRYLTCLVWQSCGAIWFGGIWVPQYHISGLLWYSDILKGWCWIWYRGVFGKPFWSRNTLLILHDFVPWGGVGGCLPKLWTCHDPPPHRHIVHCPFQLTKALIFWNESTLPAIAMLVMVFKIQRTAMPTLICENIFSISRTRRWQARTNVARRVNLVNDVDQ